MVYQVYQYTKSIIPPFRSIDSSYIIDENEKDNFLWEFNLYTDLKTKIHIDVGMYGFILIHYWIRIELGCFIIVCSLVSQISR